MIKKETVSLSLLFFDEFTGDVISQIRRINYTFNHSEGGAPFALTTRCPDPKMENYTARWRATAKACLRYHSAISSKSETNRWKRSCGILDGRRRTRYAWVTAVARKEANYKKLDDTHSAAFQNGLWYYTWRIYSYHNNWTKFIIVSECLLWDYYWPDGITPIIQGQWRVLNSFSNKYNLLPCSADANIYHLHLLYSRWLGTLGLWNKLLLAKILLHFRLKAASSIQNINGLFIQWHHNCYACSRARMINCEANIFVMITVYFVTSAKCTAGLSRCRGGKHVWFSVLIRVTWFNVRWFRVNVFLKIKWNIITVVMRLNSDGYCVINIM